MRRSLTDTFSSQPKGGKVVKATGVVQKKRDKPPSKLKVLEQTNDLDEVFQDTFHTWDIGDDQSVATFTDSSARRVDIESKFVINPIPAPILKGAPNIADDFSDEEITAEEKAAEAKVPAKDEEAKDQDSQEKEVLHEKRLRPMLSEEEIKEKESKFRTLLQNTRSRLITSVFAFERIFDFDERKVDIIPVTDGNKENDEYISNRRKKKLDRQQTKKALIFDQKTAVGFDARKTIKGSLLEDGNTMDGDGDKMAHTSTDLPPNTPSIQVDSIITDNKPSTDDTVSDDEDDMDDDHDENTSTHSPSQSTFIPHHTDSVASTGTLLLSPTKRSNARHNSDPLISTSHLLLANKSSNSQTALMTFKVPKKVQEQIEEAASSISIISSTNTTTITTTKNEIVLNTNISKSRLDYTPKELEEEASITSELTSLSKAIQQQKRPLSGKATMSSLEDKILKLSSAPQYSYHQHTPQFATKQQVMTPNITTTMRSLSSPMLQDT